MPAISTTNLALVRDQPPSSGRCYNRSITAPGLIGQIKKTRIHVAKLCLSEGVGSNGTACNLFTMSKYRVVGVETSKHNQTLLLSRDVFLGRWGSAITGPLLISAQKDQKNGGARRDRTDDILLAKQALSQLSYGPIFSDPFRVPKDDRREDPGNRLPPVGGSACVIAAACAAS